MTGWITSFKDGLPYPTLKDGAPEGIEILALAPAMKAEMDHFGGGLPLYAGGEVFAAMAGGLAARAEQSGLGKGEGLLSPRGSAMIAVYKKGKGEVFNAGSSMWVNGLMKGDYFTQAITRNVLDRYLGQ